MKRKKLVIISHTEHYLRNGVTVGWGATVNEINYLSEFWDEVVHIACLYGDPAPASSMPYSNNNIKFVALPPTGGKKLWNKLNIIRHMPETVLAVSKEIQNATEVQFRAPTGIGVYLLPVFSFLSNRKFTFWVKYAGNWAEKNAPLGYQFQRWWLKKNWAKCKVTINGFWNDQPKHCLSFENPCLTDNEVLKGEIIHCEKEFFPPFRLAFVGRLEDEKGVNRIIDALKEADANLIERMDFIGDGPKKEKYISECSFMGEKAVFHGFLDSQSVHRILSQAHFFLLPSESEGFPKVIAEAGCYGCIPVVSEVGSIGHYIKNESNGFLWRNDQARFFSDVLKTALSTSSKELRQKSKNIFELAKLFTFDNYRNKLESEILSD